MAFINCDPLYHDISSDWNILAAPPSWLTGHVLHATASSHPFPYDYAKHEADLVLLLTLALVVKVRLAACCCSVQYRLIMKTIALPSDSAASSLLKHLGEEGPRHEYVSTGPDYDSMMAMADGALPSVIVLSMRREFPEMVQMDLGTAWMEEEGLPMIFGVFVARRDTPTALVQRAHAACCEPGAV